MMMGQTSLVAPTRIAAPVKDGWRVFDARSIPLFRADTKYTAFAVDGHEYMITESLQALEDRLYPHGFLRVHRGLLVNLFMVRAVYRRARQTLVEMTSQDVVAVSRRHVQALFGALGIQADPPADACLIDVGRAGARVVDIGTGRAITTIPGNTATSAGR